MATHIALSCHADWARASDWEPDAALSSTYSLRRAPPDSLRPLATAFSHCIVERLSLALRILLFLSVPCLIGTHDGTERQAQRAPSGRLGGRAAEDYPHNGGRARALSPAVPLSGSSSTSDFGCKFLQWRDLSCRRHRGACCRRTCLHEQYRSGTGVWIVGANPPHLSPRVRGWPLRSHGASRSSSARSAWNLSRPELRTH